MNMEGPLVSPTWLKQNLKDQKLVVLDASIKDTISKKETDFPGIRIRNARFFDLKKSFCDKVGSLPNTIPTAAIFTEGCQKLGVDQNSTVVIYDNLGVYSSPRVWYLFHIMGFKNVAVLDGGLPSWINHGFDTEPIKPETYKKGNFKATYQMALTSDKEDILKNISTNTAFVVDARSKERFYAKVQEPRDNMRSGHIPGSINLPYTDVLENGEFRSKTALKEILNTTGLSNKPLIFSCGSGITACIILLACDLVLENQTSLYDGSWSEWGGSHDLPISV